MSDNHASIDSQIEHYEDRISAAGYDPEMGSKTEPPEKDNPSLFDESREGELRKSLGAIYDKHQAKAERAEELQIYPRSYLATPRSRPYHSRSPPTRARPNRRRHRHLRSACR